MYSRVHVPLKLFCPLPVYSIIFSEISNIHVWKLSPLFFKFSKTNLLYKLKYVYTENSELLLFPFFLFREK